MEIGDFKIGERIVPRTDSRIDGYVYIGKAPEGHIITLNKPEQELPLRGYIEGYIWRDITDWIKKSEANKVVLTKKEIADKIGINVNDLEIVD